MASAGMKKSLGKSTYKKVQSYITSLDKHLDKLHDDVVKMNKEAWYGGSIANKWYNDCAANFKNCVSYRTILVKAQEQIDNYCNGYDKL